MLYTTLVRVLLFSLLVCLCVPGAPARADDAATSTPAVATTTEASPSFETIQLTVRAGDSIATSSLVTLPLSATSTTLTPTGTTTPIVTSATSVLAALESLAASSTEFSITDLQYYASYGAFYLNCLSIPSASSTPLCGQWQYSVNNVTPSVSMDSYPLRDHDTVFVYFGYPRMVALAAPSTTTGTPFIATAQSYDPATNTYAPASGLVVGITQPDPANPWSPIIIATSTSDEAGHASFTINTPGDYAVGLAADYYTPATALSVVDAPTSTPPSSPTPAPVGGGGGGSYNPPQGTIPGALAYLLSQQKKDGSFTGTFIDDWVALTLAHSNASQSMKDALAKYLDTAPVSSITDYERRAMALEALGENPYDRGLIQHVVDSFDGTQIGDATSVNDDIFALFPLLHAGYSANDPLIDTEVAFMLAQQSSDGSWGSIDMTAAAVQALAPLTTLDGVSSALTKAKTYLLSQEANTGCVGNEYATSWVLQAIAALGDTPVQWQKYGMSPLTCLATYQQADGGFEPTATDATTRIWATAYALDGLASTPWNSLLQNFPRPTTTTLSSGGSTPQSASTSSPKVATTTAPLIATATSTTDIIASTTHTTATSSLTAPLPPQTIPPESSTTVSAHSTVKTYHPSKSIFSLQKTAPPPPATFAQSIILPSSQVAGAAASIPKSLVSFVWHYVMSLLGMQ